MNEDQNGGALLETCATLHNRAAALYKVRRYNDAICDLDRAMALIPTNATIGDKIEALVSRNEVCEKVNAYGTVEDNICLSSEVCEEGNSKRYSKC